MNEITVFDYEGQQITFEFADGNKMINATEMAKPFKGKLVADFLRLKSTKDYIELLWERYGNSHIAPVREVLRIVKGGDAAEGLQGTWMDGGRIRQPNPICRGRYLFYVGHEVDRANPR